MTFTCQSCRKVAEVVWPLLYHDMERDLMVHIRLDGQLPEGQAPEPVPVEDFMRGFALRTVASRNELVEKVLIFEDGLDDRIIEIFKIALRRQLEQDAQATEGELMFSACGESEDGRRKSPSCCSTGRGRHRSPCRFRCTSISLRTSATGCRTRTPRPGDGSGSMPGMPSR